jgi:hypothetical protein
VRPCSRSGGQQFVRLRQKLACRHQIISYKNKIRQGHTGAITTFAVALFPLGSFPPLRGCGSSSFGVGTLPTSRAATVGQHVVVRGGVSVIAAVTKRVRTKLKKGALLPSPRARHPPPFRSSYLSPLLPLPLPLQVDNDVVGHAIATAWQHSTAAVVAAPGRHRCRAHRRRLSRLCCCSCKALSSSAFSPLLL